MASAATARAPALLTVSAMNAWYGDAHILRDVALEVRRGEVVALMGRNGAGKSTTFKSIMGLLQRRDGSVSFMGNDLNGLAPYQIARLGLGYVPEDRRIFTDLTVHENLLTGKQAARTWPDASAGLNWCVEDIYHLFPALASMRDRPGGEMSGGEQQMLTVARTLMGNPFMLLLDEPSEGVAPVVVEQMVKMIQSLKSRGASILLSEQNLHFARLVADRVYVLEKGVVQYQGTMQHLADDRTLLRSYLSF